VFSLRSPRRPQHSFLRVACGSLRMAASGWR